MLLEEDFEFTNEMAVRSLNEWIKRVNENCILNGGYLIMNLYEPYSKTYVVKYIHRTEEIASLALDVKIMTERPLTTRAKVLSMVANENENLTERIYGGE